MHGAGRTGLLLHGGLRSLRNELYPTGRISIAGERRHRNSKAMLRAFRGTTSARAGEG
jgi:hypothetical protein